MYEQAGGWEVFLKAFPPQKETDTLLGWQLIKPKESDRRIKQTFSQKRGSAAGEGAGWLGLGPDSVPPTLQVFHPVTAAFFAGEEREEVPVPAQ